LLVEKKRKSVFLYCKKCKKKTKLLGEKVTLTESMQEAKRDIVVMDKDEGIAELPKTKMMCPKCDNVEAYWWMQQTRAADEPPTIFYRCTKCGYSWRSYG